MAQRLLLCFLWFHFCSHMCYFVHSAGLLYSFMRGWFASFSSSGTYRGLLSNKSWVRLCGDGCHRISTEGFMLITLGFLAKGPKNDISRGSQSSSEDFVRTSFYELCFAMVSKESLASYQRTFAALKKSMELCCKVDSSVFTKSVLQMHGDLHCGLEGARRSEFPGSKRCMDFSHMTGAVRQRVSLPAVEAEHGMCFLYTCNPLKVWTAGCLFETKCQKAVVHGIYWPQCFWFDCSWFAEDFYLCWQESAEEKSLITAWRSGIFKVVGSALIDKEILERLISMVRATRPFTRAVFCVLWGLFFSWLESFGETDAIRLLLLGGMVASTQ